MEITVEQGDIEDLFGGKERVVVARLVNGVWELEWCDGLVEVLDKIEESDATD